MDLRELSVVMRNDINSLGFGPAHGYVRPSPCGPIPVHFHDRSEDYPSTIVAAVADHLRFTPQQRRLFNINLSAILGDLMSYTEDGVTSDHSRFEPARHLSTGHQTYPEFTMLLQAVADKQQQDLAYACQKDHVSYVYCFEETNKLGPWVKEWIAEGE